MADQRGPSEDEIRGAFATLVGAWGQVANSVGGALRDPEVREHLMQAASAFATAIGATLSELGTELQSDPSVDAGDGSAGPGRTSGEPA
jgi:hypothetical protein